MPLTLSSPITDLSGVGPAKAKILAKLGLHHLRDLLFLFPRRHEDFSRLTTIKDLQPDHQVTIHGRVKSCRSDWGWRGRQRLLRIFVEIEDETGVLSVIWYNLQFLPKQLWKGREIFLAGIAKLNQQGEVVMHSPALEFASTAEDMTHVARITPIYPETKGVTSRWLRYQTKKILPLVDHVPEYMPAPIRQDYHLIGIHDAIKEVHFPSSSPVLEVAQQRLRFDELFFLQLAAQVRRQQWHQRHAPTFSITASDLKKAVKELPFSLTGAQKRALQEVVADITTAIPMNRLLQGDVGSGKSAVALVAARLVIAAGYKVLYIAPTEILARQQYDLFRNHLGEATTALLVGSLTAKQKQIIKDRVQAEGPLCVIGTHALLQPDIAAAQVGLAIIDEQHRFGVSQRQMIQHHDATATPHLLSMTATPIPRTLNLTVYGDLDVSVLDEIPPGRTPIITRIANIDQREPAIVHILQELHKGRQAYVIAPLIADSDKLQAKSALTTYKEMTQFFPGIAIGLVHGQMPAEEKEAVMNNFAAGAIQMLVATAVIEVGVNVPNATVMVIEGAERFGLAQLHQCRGRVGRGSVQSYCYLFPTTLEDATHPRLTLLTQTADGFVIAEEDLKMRGPGEVYGVAQSGFNDLKVASLLDYQTIKNAQTAAKKLLKSDPELKKYPILKQKVSQKNQHVHFE